MKVKIFSSKKDKKSDIPQSASQHNALNLIQQQQQGGGIGQQVQIKSHDFCGTVMILGNTESGKTTLQRQLDILYGTEALDPKYYQRLIYANTLATLIRFIENSELLNVSISPDNVERVKRVLSQPSELARNKLPRFPLKLGWDCKCLWEDKGIQAVYSHSKNCSEFRTPGRPKYYMDRMFKVFDPHYTPTEMDIISAYDQNDTIQSSTILYKRFKVDLFGTSGRESTPKNWSGLYQSYKPNYIFYIVALKDYFSDQLQTPDSSTSIAEICRTHVHKNLLLESLNSFESLVRSELFEKSLSVYLIFNTSDIFYENMKQFDLRSCFPDYDGTNDPEQAISFISDKFTKFLTDKEKPFKTHVCNLLDKANVRDEFEMILEQLRVDAEKRGFTTPWTSHNSSPVSSIGSNNSSRLPGNTSVQIPGLYDIEVSNKRQQQQLLQQQQQLHQHHHPSSTIGSMGSSSINSALDSNTDSSYSNSESACSSMTSLPTLPTNNNNTTTTTTTTSTSLTSSLTSSTGKDKPPKAPKVKEEKPPKVPKVKEEKPPKVSKVKEEKPPKVPKVKEEKPPKVPKVKEEKPPKVKEEKVPKVKEEKPPKVKEEKPPKEETPKKKKVKGATIQSILSGHGDLQGRRKNMEDTHALYDDLLAETKYTGVKDDQISYYAVYDGHGGTETSKALEPIVHKCLVETQAFKDDDYEKALKDAYAEADKLVIPKCEKSGSTGVSALLVGTTLYTANVGDSEIVLARTSQNSTPKNPIYEPILLSYKHLASDDQEKKRITEMGGMIIFNRLFGSLAVSRSFGDKEYKEGEKKFCVADPYQTTTELTNRDHFFILACDGLWDKIEYDEAVQITQKNIKLGKNSSEISQLLAQESYDRGSTDNITVLVVILNWK